MLTELRVVDAPMVIHHVDGAAVLAHDEIGGIAERPTVQSIQRHFAAAHDRVGCVVVGWVERVIQRNGVQVGESPSGRKDIAGRVSSLLGTAWGS